MSLAIDLQTVTESLSMTVFGSEFQAAGAEQWKAPFANVVFGDGSDTDVVADRVNSDSGGFLEQT